MAQLGQKAEDSFLRRIRLRSPGRMLLVIAAVSLIVGTQGQFLNPVFRAVNLSCELLHLRGEHQQLGETNKQLAEEVAYLKTDEGQQLAARKELGALNKGERLVICRPQELQSAPPGHIKLAQLVYQTLQRGCVAVRGAGVYLADLGCCLFGTRRPSADQGSNNTELEAPPKPDTP